MYKYKVQIKKVSGSLNESVLPSKILVVKSKTKKSKSAVLAEASKFFKKKYGLVIESAEITDDLTSVMTSSIGQQVARDLKQAWKQYYSLGDTANVSPDSVKQTLETIFSQLSNSARRVKAMISSISAS